MCFILHIAVSKTFLQMFYFTCNHRITAVYASSPEESTLSIAASDFFTGWMQSIKTLKT